jgi:hypothetical protein
MESNVEPEKTGKRKRTILPRGEEKSVVCVCRLALFKFVIGMYQTCHTKHKRAGDIAASPLA